jgi:hypothetical protein
MGLVQILKTGVFYFLLVFGAGFMLGTGRVLFLVPLLGERRAELWEIPVMLVVIVMSARWIVVHRLDHPGSSLTLAIGFIAMGLVLMADLAVGVLLRGMSPEGVFFNRDPISGTAYYMSLLFFAVMPTITARLREASFHNDTMHQNSG